MSGNKLRPRRKFLKSTGAIVVAGSSLLAGCSSDGGGGGDGGGGNGSDGGGGDGSGGDGSGGDGGGGDGGGEEFPTKEIRWVIPYSPGGGYDTYSRAIANRMPQHLSNSVNIFADNVPGAGGRRGANEIYNAEPDGYTFGIFNTPGMVVAQTIKETEYDLTEISWFGRVVQAPYVMLAAGDGPFSSIDDVINYDNTIRVGATGPGSTAFLVSTIALNELEVDYEFVTGFEGSQEQAAAVLRDEIDLFHTSMGSSTAKSFVEGEGQALLYYGDDDSRPEYLPSDVPTAEQAGYDSLQGILASHRLVGGPPGLPEDRHSILEEAFLKTLKSDEMAEWAEEAGRPIGPVIDGEETLEVVHQMQDTFKQYEDILAEEMG